MSAKPYSPRHCISYAMSWMTSGGELGCIYPLRMVSGESLFIYMEVITMAGWVHGSNDAGTFSLEALRKSDVVCAVYAPEYDCAVLVARSRRGKERVLAAWSDALHTGIVAVADLLRTGVGVDARSMGVWFS